MVREIIKPNSNEYILNLPKEYVNQELEIIVLPLKEKKVNVDNKEVKEFSNHSANIIDEWLDESEDEVWK